MLAAYLERTTGRRRFDVAFCFSTTMWVHLNHGDAGLEALLRTLAAWADSVVVEPQPWKCYRNAARRMKRANVDDPFPHLQHLRYREIHPRPQKRKRSETHWNPFQLYEHHGNRFSFHAVGSWNSLVIWELSRFKLCPRKLGRTQLDLPELEDTLFECLLHVAIVGLTLIRLQNLQ